MQERVGSSKIKQAMRQTIQSDLALETLSRSGVGKGTEVFDVEGVKSKGVTVVAWDGM